MIAFLEMVKMVVRWFLLVIILVVKKVVRVAVVRSADVIALSMMVDNSPEFEPCSFVRDVV